MSVKKKLIPLSITFILLALLAALLSMAKFEHCQKSSWATPDAYVHACYSDISALYSARSLNNHQWSYQGGASAVEYPVVTGVVMWATSWLVPAGKNSLAKYFDINVLFLLLLFIFITLIVGKIRPEFTYLLPLSPAVIASLYINWDLWGIISMLLAIYYFDKGKFKPSAALLGLSIATKFFPLLLLFPIIFILWRRREIRTAGKYFLLVALTWLVINLPVALTTPTGWWRFYQLNLDRQSDWGSLWYGLSLLGVHLPNLNLISLLSFLALIIGLGVYLFSLPRVPALAEVSFIFLGATLSLGKVYSPQYILWLTPLAVLALLHSRQLFAFWLWQAGEALYHLAIWQHMAQIQGSHFGLPDTGYALASLIRIATALFFIATVMRHPKALVEAELNLR